MSVLGHDRFRELMNHLGAPSVSLYLPTHRAGAEIQQDPIRLKNLLREAETKLAEAGERKEDIARLLEPAWRLVDNAVFWQHQSDGLAILLGPGVSESFRLPRSFEERVVVDDRFYLKPLLPLLTGDGRFNILALSQKNVRLFEATRDRIAELDLGDLPRSLPDALGHDWEDRSVQLHTLGSGRRERTGLFHGHGEGADDVKEELLRFLQVVEAGLRNLLEGQDQPLVVAAVDYVIAMFREVSHHRRLVEGGVVGNPDGVPLVDLHRRSWELVEPVFRRERDEAAQRFHALVGTGRATNDLREIVPAAFDGRVDTLFVSTGVESWGIFDPEERRLELHTESTNGDEDLLDRAALESLRHGGTVYAVDGPQVPGDGPAAALYRF